MKPYPSIPHVSDLDIGKEIVAFYKYDGSNIRAEWNNKSGWYKFGTRTRLLDKSDPEFGEAIPLFFSQFGPLDSIFRDTFKITNATVYCEFLGPHSFSGIHNPKLLNVEHNDPKRLVLFDVNVYKKGFIDPETFVKLFSDKVLTAEVVYRGILTEEFVCKVKNNELNLREGVICKCGVGHSLSMCKIKTNAYLDELKKRFSDKWQDYL